MIQEKAVTVGGTVSKSIVNNKEVEVRKGGLQLRHTFDDGERKHDADSESPTIKLLAEQEEAHHAQNDGRIYYRALDTDGVILKEDLVKALDSLFGGE